MNRNPHRPNQTTKFFLVLLACCSHAPAEEKSRTLRVIVSIPDHKLALVDGDRITRIFNVGVGKPSTPSPEGEFTVATRIANPTWYGPRKVVGPGKANPLGTRWLGLNIKGYGIHGTNAPRSIGKHASHGCIRMRNADIEALFELVPVGTPVALVGSPDELLRRTLTAAD